MLKHPQHPPLLQKGLRLPPHICRSSYDPVTRLYSVKLVVNRISTYLLALSYISIFFYHQLVFWPLSSKANLCEASSVFKNFTIGFFFLHNKFHNLWQLHEKYMYEAIFLLCHFIINAKVGPYIKFSVSSQKVSRGIGMGFLLTQVKDVFRNGRNNQFWQLIDQLLVGSKMPLVRSWREFFKITKGYGPKNPPKGSWDPS